MSGPAGKLGASIEAIVKAAMQRQNVPGLSIAVARGADVVFAGGLGRRNVGEDLPAGADTIYSIASISKQFTAAAIMQLAERGLLRVDDRLSRYFPWHPYGRTIELRHLLSHTSGIPDYFALDDLDLIGFTAASPREIAEAVMARGPAFSPGAEYQYCNTGYVLLGAVIERVAGESYAQHLQAYLFDPLEMTRTGVDDTPAIRTDVAVGCTSYVLGPLELARDYHPSWEFGTGGLYSTVADMLKWNRALRTGRVVNAASFAQMTTPATLTNGHPINYGFGLTVSYAGGLREVRHTGGLPGMATDNATYPERNIDIIVFANHDSCSTYATVTRPILALLLDAPGLNVPRLPDLQASTGLGERPQAAAYLRAAAAGRADDLPFSAKFERFLTPERRTRFTALASEFGGVEALALVDAARRDPETTFTYRVDFERGPLVATIVLRDDGAIAGLNFIRWDDRS